MVNNTQSAQGEPGQAHTPAKPLPGDLPPCPAGAPGARARPAATQHEERWQGMLGTAPRAAAPELPRSTPQDLPPTSLPRGTGTATPSLLEAAPGHTPCSLYLILMLQRQIFHYPSLGRSRSAFPLLSTPLPGPATSPHPRAATRDREAGWSTGSSHRARADPVPIPRARGAAQRLGAPPAACPGDRDTATAPHRAQAHGEQPLC